MLYIFYSKRLKKSDTLSINFKVMDIFLHLPFTFIKSILVERVKFKCSGIFVLWYVADRTMDRGENQVGYQ